MVVPVSETECMEGDEELRLLKMERLRAGGEVVAGGGDVVLWLEKKPDFCTGAGGGVGSRRDPKRGIMVVLWFVEKWY